MHATAHFKTEHANRYLITLCQHFASRVEATHDDGTGHVDFPFGDCDLAVGNGGLTLSVTASDKAQLDTLIDVVTRHLERFAFRENPILDWHIASDADPDNATNLRRLS